MSKIIEHKTFFIEPEYRQINYIHTEENFLSNDEIQSILKYADKQELNFGKVGQKNNNLDSTKHIRRSKICWIKDNNLNWLYNKIGSRILELNKEYWGFSLSKLDYFQYTEYDESYQGHFDWHLDIGNTCNSIRKLSISIQLSDTDDYKGGELMFKNKHKEIISSKKKGTLIIFPSYILHKVQPVLKGNRKSLIVWFKGEPFK